MLIKIIVIIMLLLIAGSLFSGLFFLFKDSGRSTRTVKALTWRVALSFALFLFLMAGYYFGLIPQRGL